MKDFRATIKDEKRRRILRLFDRKQLNRLSDRLNPEHADKATIEAELLEIWPSDRIREIITIMLDWAE